MIQMKFIGLRILLVCGVLCVDSDGMPVFVKEGDSVTLHTGVETNQQDRIKWYFNDTRLAQIIGDQSKICTDVQCDERFRDRLKLDHQTGSLTIMNTRTTDTGDYKLQIISSRSEKVFIVIVSALHEKNPAQNHLGLYAAGIVLASAVVILCFIKNLQRKTLCKRDTSKAKTYWHTKAKVETVLVTERVFVTLNTDVTEILRNDEVVWLFGAEDTLIAKIRDWKKEIHDGPDDRFRDRLKLDPQTGSLTITNTTTIDSGQYKLKITRNGKTSFKRFNVSISVFNLESESSLKYLTLSLSQV